MTDTIFGKMISGEISADFIHEDEFCVVIRDINPVAPTHCLIIPRDPLVKLSDAGEDHQALLGHLFLVANKIAKEEGLSDYRCVINNGPEAGQSVFHLHLHLMGGRGMSWPPG
ncbi:MAG TPA: histidine triad nucleotide-binding protein [Gammaproteobacteria bacterium]|nr:histidine triad nucleotide-binding protein [Gammaproteobacteria bacterium]